jgi:hypothetical protein
MRAFGGEAFGDCPADALAAAGDSDPLSFQPKIHLSLPRLNDTARLFCAATIDRSMQKASQCFRDSAG